MAIEDWILGDEPPDERDREARCKRCGAWCLWQETADGWRLTTLATGALHRCGQRAIAREFPEVPE